MPIRTALIALALLLLPLAAGMAQPPVPASATPVRLFYSDDPELVREPGVVGRVAVVRGQRTRIYFYHLNLTPEPLPFVAELRIEGPGILRYKAATVVGSNRLETGRDLTEAWVAAPWSQRYVPGPVRLVEIPVASRRLCTGLIEFLYEHEGEVLLYFGTDQRDSPRDGYQRQAVTDQIDYHAVIRVDPGPERVLLDRMGTHQPAIPGDYGMDYQYTLHFANPSERTVRYNLMLHPRAGPATGIWLVDGKRVRVPVLQTFRPYRFYSFELKPGRERTVRLWTQVAGGSAGVVHLEAWRGRVDPIYREVGTQHWRRQRPPTPTPEPAPVPPPGG